MTVILVSLVLTVLAAAPQQPRDGARVAPSGSSVLAGIVVTAERSPQPVRRAIVTITSPALGVSRSTITDGAGRFAFEALPAGRFVVTAERKAYLTSAFGAAYAGDAGTPVTVGESARVEDVRVTLWKGAVLTGVISDASGTPIPSLPVTVLRATESTYETAGEDVTNDRGVYRVYGLRPGDYIVAAAPRPSGAGDLGVRSEREVDALLSALERRGSSSIVATRPGEIAAQPAPAPEQRTYSFAEVYFPGTPVAADARRITVAAGEERSGLDFAVSVVPTASIKGIVLSASGQPAADIQISMMPVGPPVMIIAGTGATGPPRTAPDGSFSRTGVTPGSYRIVARRTPPTPAQAGAFGSASPVSGRGPTVEWAATELSVNGEDVEGISLTLQPGLRVTGRLVFEGTSEIPSKLSTVRVTLTALAASPRTRSVTAASAKADGTIEITNLLPGAYRVGLELPDDIADRWWPRSASTAGRDLLDVPLELAAGASPDVVFTLSDRRPSLSGTVQDADARPAADATIVVFSTDRTSWPRASRRVRTARPATDGHYEIRDLPPGEYFVAAIRRMQPDAAQHPDLLERIAAEAVRVVVGEGEQKALNVRVR